MKKALALALALVLAMTLFAGAAFAEAAPVTITVGNWPDPEKDPASYETYQGYLDIMAEKYPNITVEPSDFEFDLQTYLPIAASGQLPTTYQAHYTEVKSIIANGYAADLTDILGEYNYDEYLNDDALKLVSVDDRIYALPIGAYANGIMVNAKLFKDAGYVTDDGKLVVPKTWDELAQTAADIQEKTGAKGFMFYSKSNMGGWMFTNLGWTYGVVFEQDNGDGTFTAAFNSEEAAAAMQFLHDLKWKHNVLPENTIVDRTDGLQLLATDQLAMIISPPDVAWELTNTYGMDLMDIGEFAIPSGPAGQAVLTGGTARFFAPNATPEQIDAGIKWLQVTGYSPEATDDVVAAKTAHWDAQAAEGRPVSNVNMSVWAGGTAYDAEHAIIEERTNMDMNLFADYIENGSTNLHAEEPVAVQALYQLMDTIIQEVFTNESADIPALLEEANTSFQTNNLDVYNASVAK